jgi:hypothetical protein
MAIVCAIERQEACASWVALKQRPATKVREFSFGKKQRNGTS